MEGYVDSAFPAGFESDSSNDEWDSGRSSVRQPPRIKETDSVVPQAEDNMSVLKEAISQGDIQTVERLLDNGMDVEIRLGFEWTPLMCAVSVANYDLAKVLLDRGASANSSKDHWTVLMASCTASASEDKISRCMELLLSRNADPNMADRSHMTCLMLAAKNGYTKVINLLVAHAADVNVQDDNGYTALSMAVHYGQEEAVLKLLQLGADKTIRNKAGNSPADLALNVNHKQIARILTSSSHVSTMQPMEKLLGTSEPPSSKESVVKLDDLGILLHGLDLGYLTDIMTENDITWSRLLTMEEEELEKVEDDCQIGITDPVHQQKLLSAVQKMHLDKVDLNTLELLGATDSGSEELHTFLASVLHQCCYLTEKIQEAIKRFPPQASQLVFSLDSKKEAQNLCNQLVVQTKDLQKEVTCLRSLLCQMNEAGDSCQLPALGSHGNWRMQCLTTVTLGTLGAACLVLLYRAAHGRVHL